MIWQGSPTSNPEAATLGTWYGQLSRQSMALRDGIGAVRMHIRYGQTGFMPMPRQVEILMDDGTRIRADYCDGASCDRGGVTRLTLAQWDGPCFTWVDVTVRDDTIIAIVRRSPAEPNKEYGPNPVILPPEEEPIALGDA